MKSVFFFVTYLYNVSPMKKILLLIPLMLLIACCSYFSFVIIKNHNGVWDRFDLDVVKYCLWVAIVIDCFLILRGNKKRQDEYRKLIDSIGNKENKHEKG